MQEQPQPLDQLDWSKVYKKCPLLLHRLWKILQTIWVQGIIPASWRVSEGCFVPKEKVFCDQPVLHHLHAECISQDFPPCLGKAHDNLHGQLPGRYRCPQSSDSGSQGQ